MATAIGRPGAAGPETAAFGAGTYRASVKPTGGALRPLRKGRTGPTAATRSAAYAAGAVFITGRPGADEPSANPASCCNGPLGIGK
ncbi:hypothetical protein FACS189493_3270 [Spirochaetia bacterium]|nr:hypothetical protein FACS189493_3270 [Spirochaetia bacterium]